MTAIEYASNAMSVRSADPSTGPAWAVRLVTPSAMPADDFGPGRSVPLVMSREEAYYYSPVWQAGVEESRQDMEAGDFT